ncbi:MAG: PAS domain-containing protein [Magnetococcales bacterium]|nr:PAS domain-containing protein [Magnetococcales bacterium]
MKRNRKKTAPMPRHGFPKRIFKYSPDVVLTVDSKRRILFMSRAMDTFKPAEMIGCDAIQLFPVRVRPWFRQSIQAAFLNNESGRFQYPSETSVWWEIRLVPYQRDGKVAEVMIVATEVTASRILQAQAIRHARLATIGVLAASIAHEINNPNNAILFNASLVARAWKDAVPILEEYFHANGDFSLGGLSFAEARTAQPAMLEEINHNTLRVKTIVENLKHLARRDQEIPFETVNLHEPLQAAIMILNYKIRKHTDYCEFLPTKTPLTVKGNSRQLEQVFINLILNALQSLSDRNAHVWIRTALETDNNEEMALITIEDQGCGISPEHLSQVTEPFFTTKSATDGTGLGLSISHLIIRNHFGAMRFVSELGRGTTVSIRLPVLKVE